MFNCPIKLIIDIDITLNNILGIKFMQKYRLFLIRNIKNK